MPNQGFTSYNWFKWADIFLLAWAKISTK